MDYAIQLLLPVIGGLLLGQWLSRTYGVSPLWSVVLAILGMFAGIAILYKRFANPALYPKRPVNPSKIKPDETAGKQAVPHEELHSLYQDFNNSVDEDDGPELSEHELEDPDERPRP